MTNLTIPMTFEATAQRRSAHTAVIYLGTSFSYAKVRTMAECFAAALCDKGLQPGERVMKPALRRASVNEVLRFRSSIMLILSLS